MVIGCGNLGAPPHEPLMVSKRVVSASSTPTKNASSSGSGSSLALPTTCWAMSASTKRWPAASTWSRSSVQARHTPSRTCVKDGIPWWGRSG